MILDSLSNQGGGTHAWEIKILLTSSPGPSIWTAVFSHLNHELPVARNPFAEWGIEWEANELPGEVCRPPFRGVPREPGSWTSAVHEGALALILVGMWSLTPPQAPPNLTPQKENPKLLLETMTLPHEVWLHGPERSPDLCIGEQPGWAVDGLLLVCVTPTICQT